MLHSYTNNITEALYMHMCKDNKQHFKPSAALYSIVNLVHAVRVPLVICVDTRACRSCGDRLLVNIAVE